MIKTYVLDTNILLQDSDAIFNFKDNNVIIPIGVIEELDRFKKGNEEINRNARLVSRKLDELRGEGCGLRDGVKLSNGGTLRVCYNGNLNSFYKEDNVDLHVIKIAQETAKKDDKTPCIIVSRDVNVRIRANALGLLAEDYEATKITEDDLDCGFSEVEVDIDLLDKVAQSKEVSIEGLACFEGFHPNHYFNIVNKNANRSIMAKVSSSGNEIVMLAKPPSKLNIRAKGREQSFVIDALLDPEINLVCIAGKAGTGKTILACACGFYQTMQTEQYEKLLVSRPVFPMGNDIGFLPGDINEKLSPWMSPIYDAFDVLKVGRSKDGKGVGAKKFVADNPQIEIEPLTYIRGRSIHNQFLLIDESQNLSPLEVKTIITRAGENTKIVLTGDVEQIDNPYVDRYSNGLSVTINAFRDSGIAAHIIMSKGIRSRLSEEATNRM